MRPHHDRLIFRYVCLTALGVYGLSLLGAALATPQPDGSQPSAYPSTAQLAPLPETLLGFAINLHHTDHFDEYLHAVDEIAAMGFNCLQVATPAFQTDGASQEIALVSGPGRGPTRERLISLLHHAKRRGLTTMLMPQVLFTHPRGNEWRGKIHPDQWEPWWHSYRDVTKYFLDIANEAGVDIYCIGSELLSTERQTKQWASLITYTRSQFAGRLTYSTNWDHYHVPAVWRDLDMIGVNGYWDLTQGTSSDPPTPEELSERWGEIRRQLMAFGVAQRRPILFTEIGYPSLPWALRSPWNYVSDEDTTPDHGAQSRGYQAFLKTWNDLLISQPNTELLSGALFYHWDPYHRGGENDTGYGIRGKPAQNLLRNWLTRQP